MHVLTLTEAKKVVLFPENSRVKIFLSLTRPHSQMCIRIKKKKKKQNKKTKKIKRENLTGYNNIVCEFALRTIDLLDRVVNFSWLFI